jgi:NADH-quinone oxidoreductase subunit M
VGMIYERYHTRDMRQLGGLWNRLPILAFFLILAAMGSAAVPGLNGFVGEFPILVGAFQKSPRTAVLAATGMILGACYLFWMLRSVLFGPLREPVPETAAGAGAQPHGPVHHEIAPIGWHEIAGMAPVLFLVVLIGVFPAPIVDQIRPAVASLNSNVQAQLARAERDRKAASEPMPPQRRRRGAVPKKGGGADTKASAKTSGAGGAVKKAPSAPSKPANS